MIARKAITMFLMFVIDRRLSYERRVDGNYGYLNMEVYNIFKAPHTNLLDDCFMAGNKL